MSIRWKIAALCLLVVFVPLYVLNRYAVTFFDRFTRRALEERMGNEAMVAGMEYLALGDDADGETMRRYDVRLRHYIDRFGTQLAILDPDGTVRHDPGGELAREDLTRRREVLRAMEGRYGARWQLTPDRGYIYYYVAVPIQDDSGNVRVVAYAWRHTAPIIRAIQQLADNQRLAAWISLAAAALLAVAVAWTLTRRLRNVTRNAQAFARGEAPFHAPRGRDEIGRLGRAVAEMSEEIARKNGYNRDLLATTAHELRSPVTAIRGAAELLQQGAARQPEALEKFTGNIIHQCKRLNRMITDLSILTRIDAEDLRGRLVSMDLNECLPEMLERLLPGLPAAGPVPVLIPCEQPLPVRIVPELIEQVLANLLSNACRHTPAGGTVEIRTERLPTLARLEVRDSGCGMEPGTLAQIFDRFFSTSSGGTRDGHGSGLGLSIARSLVERHGGSIRADSETGQGASLFFTLPLAPG